MYTTLICQAVDDEVKGRIRRRCGLLVLVLSDLPMSAEDLPKKFRGPL